MYITCNLATYPPNPCGFTDATGCGRGGTWWVVVELIFAAGLAGGAVAGGAVAGGFCGITTEVAIGALRSNSGSAVAYDACTNGGSAPSVKKIVIR